MIYSPLEQFEIGVLVPFYVSFASINIDISISTLMVYHILGVMLMVGILFLGTPIYFIQNIYTVTVESLWLFIVDTINSQAGLRSLVFAPVLLGVFLLIVGDNLVGLVPFGFSPTSHLSVTAFLAVSFSISFLLKAIQVQGVSFVKIFVPSGVPVVILPLVVVIELVSYLIRPLSLALRLFANLMAGHTLLHIVAGFVTQLWIGGLKILALVPFCLLVFVSILELGIAVLQGYVFVVLLSIYSADVWGQGGH